MSTRIVCIPVAPDGQVGHSWGKAPAVALATVEDGAITAWEVHDVAWNVSHDLGAHGTHHGRVARFILEHGVTDVVASHMGDPMVHMLTKLGVDVRLGAAGDARAAACAPRG